MVLGVQHKAIFLVCANVQQTIAPHFCCVLATRNHGKNMAKHLDQPTLTTAATDRIIEMAWEDRTPFEAIAAQFGLAEAVVIKLMRKELKLTSFKLWRKRLNSGVSSKHLHRRNEEISRFKCSRQRSISGNKIAKR
jgi:uncharacterized protein (TIGR03643 family)